jgi:poly(3-hydroxybutyrate) depolymerase
LNAKKKASMLVAMRGLGRALFLIFLFAGFSAQSETLPALGIDVSQTTVSGLSSGAFFAVQFATAHSAKVHGVASFAGGVYNCAEGDLVRASAMCMKEPQALDLQRPLDEVRKYSQAGLIDEVENISRQKVFLFHGQKDTVVDPRGGEKLAEFYLNLGASVVKRFDLASGHGFPSEQAAASCETNQKPWLNNCSIDGAGEMFQALYGPLVAAVPMKRQNLFTFSQSDFDVADVGMTEEGHIYIPQVCRQEPCRLHIAFHGCQQNPTTVADQFVIRAGYNNWAESNHLIVLYPNVVATKKNPQGCWDWYGYSGKDYALKSGRQIMVVHKMLMRLKQPRP